MKKRTVVIVSASLLAAGVVVIGGVSLVFFLLTRSGITRPIDDLFGDQHLKTTVALVELHKLRYGRYPASLSELRFIGSWDAIALNAVDYCSNPDGDAYYVEVRRGWTGKPQLSEPREFWDGTGYSAALGPCKQPTMPTKR